MECVISSKMRSRRKSSSCASASAASSAGGRRVVLASELMERLLHEPPASPPLAEYRARGAALPLEPMTLRELYDGRYEVIRSPRWREQLLDRPAHKRNSETDVAEMVLALDEGMLSDMLAFEGDGKGAHCYVSGDSGVWRLSMPPSYHELYEGLVELSDRLDRVVMTPLKGMIRRQRASLETAGMSGSSPRDLDELQARRMESEEHMEELVSLYERLRRVGYQQGVMKRMVTKRLVSTRAEGVREEMLDATRCCVAFEDGVYCFEERRLLRGASARSKYQTQTVKYRFEDMRAVLKSSMCVCEEEDEGDERMLPPMRAPDREERKPRTRDWEEYDEFVERIYGANPGLREYVMDALASSALNELLQVILFHHGDSGSNGKSTFFTLVQSAFGDLHEACSASMLNASSKTSAGSANEELMSTKSKRLVQMTELCSKDKLSAASIKGITGGDQQTARGLYQKKQKFVNRAVLHLLCNTIPELNDGDGGTMRRLRCVPYVSRFVDASEEVDESRHVYRKQEVTSRFETWKYYLMHEVMTAAQERASALSRGERAVVTVPGCVTRETRKLVERESTVSTFLEAMLERTGEPRDRVTLASAYDAYVEMCGDGKAPEKKAVLKVAMLGTLGPFANESNGWRNYWRGWRLKGGDVGGSAHPPGKGE